MTQTKQPPEIPGRFKPSLPARTTAVPGTRHRDRHHRGRQPVELTARRLLRVSELPHDWAGQRLALGFEAGRKAA